MKVVVVGAGIAGLAIAIRLAVKGHEVVVYEKNPLPGGKLSEMHKGGFRFDTGPSLFTLPELIEELFTLCGEEMEEHLPYRQLPVNCRYFYPDGTEFSFYQQPDLLMEEIREKTTEDPENIRKRLDESRELYQIGAPVFIFNSFHKLSNFNTPPFKNIVFKLPKFNFFSSMHAANRKDFKDKRIVQLFDRYATYNGSDPYRAPATLNMIAHLENNIGAFFPEKGMYSIAKELYGLACRRGVTFHFNTTVEEIIIKDKKATAIRTGEERVPYDEIITGADVKSIAGKLIPNHPLKKLLNRQEPSSSALIFYWGINRTYPGLDVHNILFSVDYRTEFRKLFKEHTFADDVTVYLFISSKIVPGDAPEDSENWFVMVNAPSDCGQDWDKLVTQMREIIIKKINRTLHTEIEKHIVEEEITTPPDIEKKTASVGGALYGTSSNSMFSAFLRHPNFFYNISHLYFTGGSVHPGGGIPLCLASARIVEQEISERYG